MYNQYRTSIDELNGHFKINETLNDLAKKSGNDFKVYLLEIRLWITLLALKENWLGKETSFRKYYAINKLPYHWKILIFVR